MSRPSSICDSFLAACPNVYDRDDIAYASSISGIAPFWQYTPQGCRSVCSPSPGMNVFSDLGDCLTFCYGHNNQTYGSWPQLPFSTERVSPDERDVPLTLPLRTFEVNVPLPHFPVAYARQCFDAYTRQRAGIANTHAQCLRNYLAGPNNTPIGIANAFRRCDIQLAENLRQSSDRVQSCLRQPTTQ